MIYLACKNISIGEDTKLVLDSMKLVKMESYNSVIIRLIEKLKSKDD